MACAVGDYVVGRLSNTQAHVKSMSEYLDSKLEEMVREGKVKEVRGRGLMRGVVVDDPIEVVGRCREDGVLVLSAGSDAVRLIPSVTVNINEINVALTVLAKNIRR